MTMRRSGPPSQGDDDSNALTTRRPVVTPVAPDASPAAESVYQAAVTKQHPERMSPMFMPKPFDRQAYEKNPEAYLAVHEPGRVWQSAQPGEGVPVLERIGRRMQVIRQGESVRLKVKTEPGMPVTFASFDLGTFDNGLTVISVAADEEGIAEAAFHGSNVFGNVHILAASPVATERVKFQVFVATPPATSVAEALR